MITNIEYNVFILFLFGEGRHFGVLVADAIQRGFIPLAKEALLFPRVYAQFLLSIASQRPNRDRYRPTAKTRRRVQNYLYTSVKQGRRGTRLYLLPRGLIYNPEEVLLVDARSGFA